MLAAVVFRNQLDADPEEERRADKPEPRVHEQAHREEREQDAQPDRAEHAPEDSIPPLPLRQVAAGQRDHDRVVAREEDVDENDLGNRDPELRRDELSHVELLG